MVTKSKSPQRDADATRQRIIDAASRVLARQGPMGFGVNAIAREAKCDKVLVYRYFGGIDELAAALGDQTSLWLNMDAPDGLTGRYGATMRSLLSSYLRQLRGNRLVRRILAWELLEDTAPVRALGNAKSLAIREWFKTVRSRAGTPPADIDAPAVNAVLLAAIHHLALREASGGDFAGIDLRDEANWTRLARALDTLAARAYPDRPEETSR